MNIHYLRFFQYKKDLRDENIAKFSDRTLKYYDMLKEAVDRVEYEESKNYLLSVLNYIELNEFITDKQIEVVEKILSHPSGCSNEYGNDVPF